MPTRKLKKSDMQSQPQPFTCGAEDTYIFPKKTILPLTNLSILAHHQARIDRHPGCYSMWRTPRYSHRGMGTTFHNGDAHQCCSIGGDADKGR